METQAPEAEPPMPEMERQDPPPEPEPQPRMPEMERRDPAPEREPPEPQEPAPEPEPQRPMETKLRFGGRIYTRRRGQKRAIAKTESSDDIHRAPSPLPSPLRPDPGSSSPQALDEFMERCRIQDQKMALLFLEDLLKELKRAGLSRFMKEEPNYRSNADSIFSLLDALRFDGGCDLKKNFEDIFSLYSTYTNIISEQIFMEANMDDLMTPKRLEEEVAKIAQQINHFESRINILKDALTAAECELKRSRDERVSYETFTAYTNVALLGASRAEDVPHVDDAYFQFQQSTKVGSPDLEGTHQKILHGLYESPSSGTLEQPSGLEGGTRPFAATQTRALSFFFSSISAPFDLKAYLKIPMNSILSKSAGLRS